MIASGVTAPGLSSQGLIRGIARSNIAFHHVCYVIFKKQLDASAFPLLLSSGSSSDRIRPGRAGDTLERPQVGEIGMAERRAVRRQRHLLQSMAATVVVLQTIDVGHSVVRACRAPGIFTEEAQ